MRVSSAIFVLFILRLNLAVAEEVTQVSHLLKFGEGGLEDVYVSDSDDNRTIMVSDLNSDGIADVLTILWSNDKRASYDFGVDAYIDLRLDGATGSGSYHDPVMGDFPLAYDEESQTWVFLAGGGLPFVVYLSVNDVTFPAGVTFARSPDGPWVDSATLHGWFQQYSSND